MLLQNLLLPVLSLNVLIFAAQSHPLSMGLNLLTITILIAMISGMTIKSFWLSYMLVLILLGGLLVIFIYVTLLASNELFVTKFNYLAGAMYLSIFSLFSLMKSEEVPAESGSNHNSFESFSLIITKFYSYELSKLTMFLILYLLLTLIVVVYNTKIEQSPLRSQM
nr:NADH dehydrogenase subunit 6 [Sida crystallina]